MGIYVTGTGIITPLGRGLEQTALSLRKNSSGAGPLTLFAHGTQLAVGEIKHLPQDGQLPRTHLLASEAAKDALTACGGKIPDAVVLGVTTGGMPSSEVLLKSGKENPDLYRYHACGSVAEYVADLCRCSGPALTVSTACSSGAAAIALGARLLQSGLAESVLAGGADALCRMTFHGFNALQLLSPHGAKPFDRDRRGMNISEGAAMLFMESAEQPPENASVRFLGLGLSCDAYHAASPDPEGRGAAKAMEEALKDAGLEPADIDYINLHGTGTTSNDAAEAKAVNRIFKKSRPRLSSIKGAFGHSLAAAGAVELAVSGLSIKENLVPANYGLENPDPEIDIEPAFEPETCRVRTVLSNSFGFGGNNAALVAGDPREKTREIQRQPFQMAVMGNACLTGAGRTEATAGAFTAASPCGGVLSTSEVSADLQSKEVRRLKRLPRLALCLAADALKSAGLDCSPSGVFFSTGWGALTETDDFLTRLFKNQEKFSSPMDFVGSVHNAPAGEIAMMFSATGPNVTMTGGDCSFEQALIAASLLGDQAGGPFLVIGADECHPRLSHLFDPSVKQANTPADGGGGLCLARSENGIQVRPVFFRKAGDSDEQAVRELIETLGGGETVCGRYGALFAGIPASWRQEGEKLIKNFQTLSGCRAPVIDYRKLTGEFASASAAAVSLAVQCLQQELIPPQPGQDKAVFLNNRSILVIGTGKYLTAVEVFQA